MSTVTPRGIISYPTLVEPRQDTDDQGKPKGDPKYSASVVFIEGTDLKKMKKDAIAIAVEKFGKAKAKEMIENGKIRFEGGSHHTFRNDVGPKGYPEGAVFVSGRTTRKPQVVDAAKTKMSDQQVKELLVPGAVVRLSLEPYWGDHPTNKGIFWGLNNVQYLGPPGCSVDPRGPEGERLDSFVAAEDEFEEDEEAIGDLDDLTDGADEAMADADADENEDEEEEEAESIADLL